MRAVGVAFSPELASRRKNEPGILPAAYMRSSTSTVSGRKSPSRSPPMVAVLRTIVSPELTTTAPPACFASLPVSKEIVLSPTSTVTRVTLNLLIRIFTSGRPDDGHRFQNSRSLSIQRVQGRAYGGIKGFAARSGADRLADDVGAGELARARRLVGPGDVAALVDQDEGAVGDAGGVDVGAEGLGDLAVRLEVGEQHRVDAELLLEGFVGVGAVDAEADQRDPGVGELALDALLVDRELIRADGAEVERIEGDQDLAALEVGERDLFPVLVFDGEVGSRVADRDHRRVLAAQAEVGDQGAVALQVRALEVTEHPPALTDQHQQAATRVVIFRVRPQVIGEFVDPLGQQRDLDLGGTGVTIAAAVLADQLAFFLFGQAHLVKSAALSGRDSQQGSTAAP